MSADLHADGDGATYGPGAILTPANIVTIIRLLAAPYAFWLMADTEGQSSWWLVLVWFVLSFSDLIDGKLARRQGVTRSGAFLDPLADKVLVLGGVGMMCLLPSFGAARFPWIAWVLIAVREVVISVFRARYARQGLAVPASKLAKWKAFLQQAAVGWVTLPWTTDMHWLALATLWIGVAAGLITMVQYLSAGARSTSATGE